MVDYFVTDRSLYENVIDLEVVARPESDHFALLLTLKCSMSCSETVQPIQPLNCAPFNKLIWNETCADKYNDILNEKINACAEEIVSLISINIDQAIDKLNECITYAAEHIKPQNVEKPNNKKYNQPKWFDKECIDLKHDKYRKLHSFHKTGLQEDLNIYLDSKRILKKIHIT